jgi:hypothetical protein
LGIDMGGGGSNNSSIDEEELERYCIGGVDLSCRIPNLMKKKKKKKKKKKTDRRDIIAKLVGRSRISGSC